MAGGWPNSSLISCYSNRRMTRDHRCRSTDSAVQHYRSAAIRLWNGSHLMVAMYGFNTSKPHRGHNAETNGRQRHFIVIARHDSRLWSPWREMQCKLTLSTRNEKKNPRDIAQVGWLSIRKVCLSPCCVQGTGTHSWEDWYSSGDTHHRDLSDYDQRR